MKIERIAPLLVDRSLLVRVYTEATSEATREAMLAAGERLVRGG